MRILDLFSGAGGAAMGLHLYWPDAEILGVDIAPQPHYPFAFEQADAMGYPLAGYDLIWVSPPCQGYSVMRHLPWLKDKDYPLLIEPIRERLEAQTTPWILENVMGAQRIARMDANWLCGTMFGKRFYRHRVFQTSFPWLMPLHLEHQWVVRGSRLLSGRARTIVFSREARHRGVMRRGDEFTKTNTLAKAPRRVLEAAKSEMEIDWMTASDLSQAIPPCYSRYLAQWVR